MFQFGMQTPVESLTLTLQQARRARRLSQLELALRVGVSQRHISFVESGRAKPSRDLLLQWLHELGVPLALCNRTLLQAGYAPAYSISSLDDPYVHAANIALDALLQSHDPMPAFVLDAHWNVQKFNRGGHALAQLLMPSLFASLQSQGTPNMLHMLLHRDGFCQHVINLAEVGPNLLAQLRQETLMHPALLPHVEGFAEQLRMRFGERALKVSVPATPLLTTRFRSAHGELAFFSMFTTFGRPHDITLSSLRVEHMFAADAHTRTIMSHLLA